MRNIGDAIESLGYAATQKRLYELGFSKGQIARAVAAGELIRVSRAWLVHPKQTHRS